MGQATQAQVCLLLVGLVLAAAALLNSACLFLNCRQQPFVKEGDAAGVAPVRVEKGLRRAAQRPDVRIICRKPLVEIAGTCQLPNLEQNLRKEAIDLNSLVIRTVKNRWNKTSFNLIIEDSKY
ncbi:uncharacterized protein LOC135937088 [Cloeon dipterum]|uniref:uncharacterized protein LOC135937088 n=1 Tax=Cloeon dipterum TaxID=197152 RepID=UPI00322001C4